MTDIESNKNAKFENRFQGFHEVRAREDGLPQPQDQAERLERDLWLQERQERTQEAGGEVRQALCSLPLHHVVMCSKTLVDRVPAQPRSQKAHPD